MPVPGPRSQFGPNPGYRNPLDPSSGFERMTRINLWKRPAPVMEIGRTPGVQYFSLRGCILAAGQIRRLYRQTINYANAQAPYSWTSQNPTPSRPANSPDGFDLTVGIRYMTRSVYEGQGIDNSRFEGLHTVVLPRGRRSPHAQGRRVTVAAGSKRGQPTVRNRMTSFGSRVHTLNKPSPAAEDHDG